MSGNVFHNGSTNPLSVRRGYVTQDDLLLPRLAVRETPQYVAVLRLPPQITPTERSAIVEKIILELRLKDCASIRVANRG